MAMLNVSNATHKRLVFGLNPTMPNSRYGFRVYDVRQRQWQLLGDHAMISSRFCANGRDGGMRVEISTVPATHNVILFADTESDHIIGCCELHVDGSLTMGGDMYIPLDRINERMPVRHINQLALVLGVRGLINLTIVDLERGFDEDIIRHKTAGKGLFVPNRYMTPTPSTGREKQFGLAMAPEAIKLPTGSEVVSPTLQSAQEVNENETVAVSNEPVDANVPRAGTSNSPSQKTAAEPIEATLKCSIPDETKEPVELPPAAAQPAPAPIITPPAFDEWADDEIPSALLPSTGRAKSSSTEPADSDE